MAQHNDHYDGYQHPNTPHENIRKVHDLIHGIKIAMLTTIDEHGHLHSRPMMTQEHDFDGELWFFTATNSDKAREVQMNPEVNLSYQEGGKFVSVAGRATVMTDVAKKRELWNESLKVWFDNGPESPEVCLIHVQAHSAQYWDTPDGMLGQLVTVVKVLLTGDKEAGGDSAKVKF